MTSHSWDIILDVKEKINGGCCACDGCLDLKRLQEHEELSQHSFCKMHYKFLIEKKEASLE